MKQIDFVLEPCPSCCSICVARGATVTEEDSPYSLSNLLHAGTIEFSIRTREFCTHGHAEDGWHPFRSGVLLPHLSNADDASICTGLDFLVDHQYLSASYRFHDSAEHIYVRIYIIPYDLPGVEGKLFLRSEVVTRRARLYLRRLLPMIDQNLEKWQGHLDIDLCQPPLIQPFLDSTAVRSTDLTSSI